MILRSGLIQSRGGVSQDAFGARWLDVHGPLARKVPFLRGYTQNHIIERFPVPGDAGLHRIDGISQLSFDDVPTMVRAMDSPEQQACIDDIKGFLSAVTLMIMQPEQVLDGPKLAGDAKLITVLFGDPTAHATHVMEMKRRAKAAGARRATHNPVIDRGHVVDSNVAAGEQVAVALGEFWFPTAKELRTALNGGLIEGGTGLLSPLAAFAVAEHRLLQFGAASGVDRTLQRY
jgi:uncharacterized protein (TIGR02118 family)